MRSRLLILALATAAIGASCGGGKPQAKGATPTGVASATLSGGAEVLKGAPNGSGTAVVRLNTNAGKACWTLTVKGIGRPLSAHVHRGPVGAVGPVVIPLGGRFESKGCVLAPPTSIAAVAKNPDAYYVNVHTSKFLNGAIRGQLHAGAAR